jgi:hypothetical protein
VLTTQADLDMIKCSLYDCTSHLLKLSGTGRKDDVDRWRTESCPRAYSAVLETKRPHARRTLGVDAAIAEIQMEEEEQEAAPAPVPQPPPPHDENLFGSSSEDEDNEEVPATPQATSPLARDLMLLNHYRRSRQQQQQTPQEEQQAPPTVVLQVPETPRNKLTNPLNQRAALERCKKILSSDLPSWSNETAVLVAASIEAKDGFPFLEEQLLEASRLVPATTVDTEQLFVLAAGLALALDRSSTNILQRLVDKGLLMAKAGMYMLTPEGWLQARSIQKCLA